MLTPYICALERANPAYGYFGTCYAYITADSTAEFIDKVLHPQKNEPIDQSEILDAINGAEKNPES